ncbi:glycosyl transferase [Desulfoluna limicola]|uniref:Glycosyl transferase n=2 Tax=Desulfoluna limicola TaxID=2810562 RepID=A0ABN6FAN7_9BACT|nr:glycosyl transferase [Desulfoluna limicola]
MNNSLSGVFHIDPEKSWRGGQQQAAYLHEGLIARGIPSWVVCRPDSPFEAYLKSKGLPCLPIPMRNEGDIFAGWRIAKAAREHNVSILHLHSAHALAIGLWASLFNRALKLVGVRRVAVPIRKNRFSRYKYNSPRMTCHVAISEAIRQVMIGDGIAPGRITTIHSGVDTRRLLLEKPEVDFRKTIGVPDDHLIIGMVAALTAEKGYPTLLMAAADVLRDHDKVTFCALGDGSGRESLLEQAEALGLGDRFRFMGFREDVGSFLHTFDVFVLASLMEGLGTSILDAQSVGLPVIASRVGGIPEVVEDGVTGLLAEPGNAEDFAGKLSRLIADPGLRLRLGENALASVTSFSIEKTVEKNVELYHSILEGEGTYHS